jgi:hypothetical protein
MNRVVDEVGLEGLAFNLNRRSGFGYGNGRRTTALATATTAAVAASPTAIVKTAAREYARARTSTRKI